MSHINKVIDADPHFVIDINTRNIKNVSQTKTSLVQYDHNSERFSFTLPRFIEGHDMMECNSVQVHYFSTANPDTKGVYAVTDLAICEEDTENVCCTWLISQNVTQASGALQFMLRFACVAADGTVDYAWHTNTFTGISITAGMNNADAVVEQYADILEQWKVELEGVGRSYYDTGEIFNDYERNKAINQYTHAEGAHTLAGAKGFRILDTVGETVTHQYYQGFVLDSIEGLEVGDKVSVRVGKHYRNVGTIRSFGATYDDRKNIVMLNGTLPSDFELAAQYKVDNAPWYNSLWVEEKPEVGTIEIGYGAHAEGIYTYALLVGAHTEGVGTIASGYYAHAEGERTKADYCSHAEGRETEALGYYSHAEGHTCKATGEATHAEGYFSEATAIGAHSEGYYTKASGRYSHTEGEQTEAFGSDAHAEGFATKATANCSHAEGSGTQATANNAHAEGYNSIASGNVAHAEGSGCVASGFASHAQGNACKAEGDASHSEGVNNTAMGEGQHVQGKHAIPDLNGDYAHIVGGGNWGAPKNIHTVDWAGNAFYAGAVECSAVLMKSPNGTTFKITVDNNGNLTTTKI